MPELPEIEIVRRSLLKLINKAKIIDIKIKNKNLRYKISKTIFNNLLNKQIIKISRKSKYLIIHFKKQLLLIHLGMSGKLFVVRQKNNLLLKTSFYYNSHILKQHNHILFFLNNGHTLIYNDVRRFGFLKLYNTNIQEKIPFLKKLGYEPFNKKFNLKYFKNFVRNKKKNIKNLLMDQTFVSGLGNIYVNEVLFVSKVNPLRACNNLNEYELKSIISNIKKILKYSISKGGASIKDFINSEGKSGNFQQFFKVYGKKNKNCSRNSCNGKIEKILISNRSSFYCNKCQTK